MAKAKIDYSRFSPEQLAAARLLAAEDEEGRKLTQDDIAQRVGITRKTLYNWRTENESFRALVNDLAEKAMDDFITETYAALRYRVAVDRSDKAIELALKRMGKLKDVSESTLNVKEDRDDDTIAREIAVMRAELDGEYTDV